MHSFAWPPVLEALGLGPDDHLLDVGCGGGVFMRHARELTGCRVTGLDHSRDMVGLAGPDAAFGKAAQLPFPDGSFTAVSHTPRQPRHFYTDEELRSLPREAGLSRSRVERPDPWAQLLVAQP